ncbi:MAG: 50S ribosomal protein L15 [Gammaproteobacteria bacterium]|nr:50S ribosomal protein L15 [Gammaproteobacteria bacterium]
MKLNTIQPAVGSKTNKLRVGRGIGSGTGKTAGRGHKGQRARSGGYHKVGFEGGQMPLQRRLPKIGFRSRVSLTMAEVRLEELNKIVGNEVTLETLEAANVIGRKIKQAKIFLSGKVTKALTIKGIAVTKGARAAIEAAGGKVVEA